ncbi:YlbD family protein [Bacillus sp. JRC01]|nr:YlbD family protein [Bacillus sp. JRC01]
MPEWEVRGVGKLHPKVNEFKEFVKKHPKIIKDVRSGQASWQELFEDWYLLGEDDTRWNSYRDKSEQKEEKKAEESKNGWMDQVGEIVKKMDANQLQKHITNLSEALGTVQGVISQFQSGKGDAAPREETPKRPSHPFSFRQD